MKSKIYKLTTNVLQKVDPDSISAKILKTISLIYMVEQFEKEAPILGLVKKSADAYRSDLDGVPVVISNKKSDVSQAYKDIAAKL